jgi:predicted Fe-Mo cluster-binding NifX family protein
MKVATVTEDGVSISQHFGRAPYYMVVTVEDGKIVEREKRDKMGHRQFSQEAKHQHDDSHSHSHSGSDDHDHDHSQTDANANASNPQAASQLHGMDPQSHNRHERMAHAISDCEAVLSRGMGAGAYQSLVQIGVKPLITDIAPIDEAVLAYASGTIVDHTERLH